MNIVDITQYAAEQAKKDSIHYYAKHERQETYHTFADKSIIPRYMESIISRSEIDTKTTFKDIRGNSFRLFPAFGASMSYMRSRFARDIRLTDTSQEKPCGIHILPRVGLTEEQRIQDIIDSGVPVGVSIGYSDSVDFIKEVISHNNVKFLSIDIAHGASGHTVDILLRLKDIGVKSGIIAGNVGSLIGFLFLQNAMEKLEFEYYTIKVGVGPGANCTTRVNTGIGIGQLGLLEEIYSYMTFVEGLNHVSVISDGGIANPGDFVKALACADGVMMGKYFVSNSLEQDVFTDDGVELFGMASDKVKGKDSYVEGGSQIVDKPTKTLHELMYDLCHGLQSAMSYVGAMDLRTFRASTEFAVNSIGAIRESDVH